MQHPAAPGGVVNLMGHVHVAQEYLLRAGPGPPADARIELRQKTHPPDQGVGVGAREGGEF